MAKTLYMITLVEPSDKAWNSVREAWPKEHKLVSDTLAFVALDGISTPGEVCDRIGIHFDDDTESEVTGLVLLFKTDFVFSGVMPTDVVDWIRAAATDK